MAHNHGKRMVKENLIAQIGKQTEYTAGENITISDGVISATDTTYTAGTGIDIESGEISVDTDTVALKTDIKNPTAYSNLNNLGTYLGEGNRDDLPDSGYVLLNVFEHDGDFYEKPCLYYQRNTSDVAYSLNTQLTESSGGTIEFEGTTYYCRRSYIGQGVALKFCHTVEPSYGEKLRGYKTYLFASKNTAVNICHNFVLVLPHAYSEDNYDVNFSKKVKVSNLIQATNIPAAPSADGTYKLTCTVSSGVATYTWELQS